MDDRGFIECPFCAEEIRVGANKCRHCKSDITEADFRPTEKQISTRTLNEDNTYGKNETVDKKTSAGVDEHLETTPIDELPKQKAEAEGGETDMAANNKELLSMEPHRSDETQSLKMIMSAILSDSDDEAAIDKAEAANTEKQTTVNSTEGGFVVEKITYLSYAAWTYLVLSFIGAFYLWDSLTWYWEEIGVAVIFALILQAVIIAGVILVFCDMASNVNTIKNKVASVSLETANDNEIEVVKKEDF